MPDLLLHEQRIDPVLETGSDTYECRKQCTDSSAGRPASARNCANRSSTWRAEIRAARSVIQIAG
jgi:hypothetical protein